MTTQGNALVIGEALVDIVVSAGRRVTETPGGSPLNVAVTLGRLGIPTQLVTALGDDPRGTAITRHLEASSVHLVEGARRNRATSTATAVVGADASATYEFEVTWDPPPVPEVTAAAVHAGSIALFAPPGCETVGTALRGAAGRTMITLDPNIRPSLLPAPGVVRAAFEQLVPLASLVKLSSDDAAWLFPEIGLDRVPDRVLAQGASIAVLTDGARGSLLASREGVVEVATPAVEVVDTIGAGDAFMGGLVARILERDLAERLVGGSTLDVDELVDMGAFAARVAAASVGRRGADPPYRHELTATEARSMGGHAIRTSGPASA